MADWAFKTNKSKKLYERACKSLPGGVSCGLRAIEAGYEPYPLFIDRGMRARRRRENDIRSNRRLKGDQVINRITQRLTD